MLENIRLAWKDNVKLRKENKELKERLDVIESILHSHLPIIEDKCKDQ